MSSWQVEVRLRAAQIGQLCADFRRLRHALAAAPNGGSRVENSEVHLTERDLFPEAGGRLAAGTQDNRIRAVFAGQRVLPCAAADR